MAVPWDPFLSLMPLPSLFLQHQSAISQLLFVLVNRVNPGYYTYRGGVGWGVQTVGCTGSLQVLEKCHHTGNSKFCTVSRFQKLTAKPVFKQGASLKATENILHSATCTIYLKSSPASS